MKSSNFQHGTSEIINITVTKTITVLFFTVASKQKKIKNENTEYHGWHLPTMQKSALLKARESHFSLIWFMEFSIISSCLGKVRVNSSLSILVNRQSLHGNG